MSSVNGDPERNIFDKILELTIANHKAEAKRLAAQGKARITGRDSEGAEALYREAGTEEAKGMVARFLIDRLQADLRVAGVRILTIEELTEEPALDSPHIPITTYGIVGSGSDALIEGVAQTARITAVANLAWPTEEFSEADQEFRQMLVEGKRSRIEGGRPKGIGHNHALILAEGLAMDGGRSNFLHPTWNDVWRAAHSDKISAAYNNEELTPDERVARIANIGVTASRERGQLIRNLDTAYRQASTRFHPRVATVIRWIRAQPEFANLTASELGSVIRRELSHDDLRAKNRVISNSPASVAAN